MISAPGARRLQAAAVFAASLAYLSYVFHVTDGQFRSSGLGDWMDPYFINGLLEHWRHSILTLSDPASPPFFYPVRGGLGYSHGLILYALIYVPLRSALHPFLAYNATILLAMALGTLALYHLLRRLGLSFVEALLLTACFASSPNVVTGTTGVWTQRASVFLVAPILVLCHSMVAPGVRGRSVRAFVAGLLISLLYVQDFYTAHFAALFAVWAGLALIGVERGQSLFAGSRRHWRVLTASERVTAIVALLAGAAAIVVFLSGGGRIDVGGVRLVARDWRRPAFLAALAIGFLALRRPKDLRAAFRALEFPGWRAFVLGGVAGAAVFAWIYWRAVLEHASFPVEEVRAQLVHDRAFASPRTFVLAGAIAVLAWIPACRVPRTARLYALWLAAASAFTWLAPLTFEGTSLWMGFIARLPGFGVIRDPKRIIYLYELAAVLGAAVILSRVPTGWYRRAIVSLALILIAMAPNRERFDYERRASVFDQWVAAPIAIDPACRSFFMVRASREYMSRSPNTHMLYANDALFLAVRHSLPTLNGYSAWSPDGWELWNPQEVSYEGRVRDWIAARRLDGVCRLDIDARTMTLLPR